MDEEIIHKATKLANEFLDFDLDNNKTLSKALVLEMDLSLLKLQIGNAKFDELPFLNRALRTVACYINKIAQREETV